MTQGDLEQPDPERAREQREDRARRGRTRARRRRRRRARPRRRARAAGCSRSSVRNGTGRLQKHGRARACRPAVERRGQHPRATPVQRRRRARRGRRRRGFMPGFANVTAMQTPDDLVLVDTGSPMTAGSSTAGPVAGRAAAAHRGVLPRPHRPRLRVAPFEEEGRSGARPARVVAHERCPRPLRPVPAHRRLQRRINRRQFSGPRARLADRVPLPRPDLPRDARRSRSAGSASSCATPAARPTTTRGPGSRTARCCAAATCSSGPRRTPATRRRSSATPPSGRPRCAHGHTRSRGAPARPRPAHRRRRSVRQALTDTADLLELPA
jgi:hypothetical protein